MKKRTMMLNDNWDLQLTNDGNIKTVSGAYSDAQNVANAVRLFTNDAFLNTQKGVPHFSLDLGVIPAMSAVRSVYRKTARAVENIASVNVDNIGIAGRQLVGSLTVTSEQGETATVEI